MNQSTIIAGALLAAFILYLAAKGRIPLYMSVLWGPTVAPVPGNAGSSGGSSGSGFNVGQAVQVAAAVVGG